MLTDFQGADLSGASLELASFIGTNFTGADFFTAGTPIANLDKADLSNAILTGVDAQNISFIDGIAIGATVTNADFSNSQLIKSDFTNALDLNTAIFAGADTTDAIGIQFAKRGLLNQGINLCIKIKGKPATKALMPTSHNNDNIVGVTVVPSQFNSASFQKYVRFERAIYKDYSTEIINIS